MSIMIKKAHVNSASMRYYILQPAKNNAVLCSEEIQSTSLNSTPIYTTIANAKLHTDSNMQTPMADAELVQIERAVSKMLKQILVNFVQG